MSEDIRQIIREELLDACLVPHQGNLIPADPDAQRRVLGCMLDQEPIDVSALRDLHFYGPVHQWLFSTIQSLNTIRNQVEPAKDPEERARWPRDMLLRAAMDHWNGKISYVADLVQDVTEAEVTHPDERSHDVETIIEMWRRRELLRLLQSVEVRVRMGTMSYGRAMARLAKGVRGA